MDKPNVPQFGKWETENVPYTAYFEKARKGRAGMNSPRPKANTPDGPLPSNTISETEDRNPESDRVKRVLRSEDYGNKVNVGRSPRHLVADPVGERSPLHPRSRHGVKDGGGGGSPFSDGKSSHDGRSRMKHVYSDDNLDKGAAVAGAPIPKFGDWDESNPLSADGYTHIFNTARVEKHAGGASVTGRIDKRTNPNSSSSPKGFCFTWCFK